MPQYQCIVAVTTSYDEGNMGRREAVIGAGFPKVGFKLHRFCEKFPAEESRPVIKNGDVEIELRSQWRNGLRNVTSARYPQSPRRRDRFPV